MITQSGCGGLIQVSCLSTLKGHSDSVRSVTISPDNKKVVSGSDDDSIKVWELNTGRLLNNLRVIETSVIPIAITSDNKKIVSGSVIKQSRCGI